MNGTRSRAAAGTRALPWPPRRFTRLNIPPFLGFFRRARRPFGEDVWKPFERNLWACPAPPAGQHHEPRLRRCPALLGQTKLRPANVSPRRCGRTSAAARRRRKTGQTRQWPTLTKRRKAGQFKAKRRNKAKRRKAMPSQAACRHQKIRHDPFKNRHDHFGIF